MPLKHGAILTRTHRSFARFLRRFLMHNTAENVSAMLVVVPLGRVVVFTPLAAALTNFRNRSWLFPTLNAAVVHRIH